MCRRSQSRMRIATTASPVSGSEVRERTVQLADESSRQWAEAHIAASVRAHVNSWRIRRAERSRLVQDGIGDGPRLPHQPTALNPLQQWQEQQQLRCSSGMGSSGRSSPRISSELVKTNSNISELFASKSSEPEGSSTEAFEASAAPHPRLRRSTFG
jgi:hypothetical protein